MPRPKIFVCHRWDYNADYYNLLKKFQHYDFPVTNYSVPEHDPLEWLGFILTYAQLAEQVRQCNYFIIIGRRATDTDWCRYEVQVAVEYRKPILAVTPRNYLGHVPQFISDADNQGGPITFHTPAIIQRIRAELDWP